MVWLPGPNRKFLDRLFLQEVFIKFDVFIVYSKSTSSKTNPNPDQIDMKKRLHLFFYFFVVEVHFFSRGFLATELNKWANFEVFNFLTKVLFLEWWKLPETFNFCNKEAPSFHLIFKREVFFNTFLTNVQVQMGSYWPFESFVHWHCNYKNTPMYHTLCFRCLRNFFKGLLWKQNYNRYISTTFWKLDLSQSVKHRGFIQNVTAQFLFFGKLLQQA